MGLKHFFHSTKTDPADPTIIGATKWNADHYYVDAAGAPVGNVGAVLLAGAAGALTHLNSVAAGQVLTSAGVAALPAWSANLTLSGDVIAAYIETPSLSVTDTFYFGVTGVNETVMRSTGNGVLKLANAAETDFSLLQFGGTTAAFPALKRSSDNLEVMAADGSDFRDLTCRQLITAYQAIKMGGVGPQIRAGTGSPEGVWPLAVGSIFLREDGGAGTTFYVKQTGGATATGWVAK